MGRKHSARKRHFSDSSMFFENSSSNSLPPFAEKSFNGYYSTANNSKTLQANLLKQNKIKRGKTVLNDNRDFKANNNKGCQSGNNDLSLKQSLNNINDINSFDKDIIEKNNRVISWVNEIRFENEAKSSNSDKKRQTESLHNIKDKKLEKTNYLPRLRSSKRSKTKGLSQMSSRVTDKNASRARVTRSTRKISKEKSGLVEKENKSIENENNLSKRSSNKKENLSNKYNFDKEHTVHIKLNGQAINDNLIMLEITFGSDGWKVSCTGPENSLVKCIRKPGYEIENFYISIDPKCTTKVSNILNISDKKNNKKKTHEEQLNINNFYRNKKNKTTMNKSKSESKPMVIIESDIEINKETPDLSVKKMLECCESTTILNTLFSSNETLLQETRQDPKKLRIKTINEINNAIETIVIKDDEEFFQSPAVKRITKNNLHMRKTKICPDYKLIKGTPFAVDAFCYGDLKSKGVDFFFLTHFHSDHYIGLSKKFCRPIFCSQITANLIDLKMKVDKKYINVIELNKPFFINDIEITALDANHCPGSIMLLIKTSEKYILHTGDFRVNDDMEFYPQLQNIKIDTIYLDTTYCKRQYVFPKQRESIESAISIVKRWFMDNDSKRTLIVVGSYLIGKEKMWLGLSKALSLKVWLDESRFDLVKAFDNDSVYLENVVIDPRHAGLHVLPLMHLNTKKLNEHLEKFCDIYDHILAIRPSGWERNKKLYTVANITIAGVAYSEHSSYEELKSFISFLAPKKIIATAGNSSELQNLYKDCSLKNPSVNTIDKYFQKKT